MALIEQLPLTVNALILISLVVCAGTVLQVATGVGLGLVASPILILSLQSETAIFVAIVLNLIVSMVLTPMEKGEVSWPVLRLLLAGTAVGVPVGWLVLQYMDPTGLKLFAGAVVLASAVQLMLLRRRELQGDDDVAPLPTLAGGGLSGFMSGCLAIPGPIAMWTMLRQNLAPSLVRANMRILFVFSYGAAFLVHVILGGGPSEGWGVLLALVPALSIGMGLGIAVKPNVSENALRIVLRILLLAMGVSLLGAGLWWAP